MLVFPSGLKSSRILPVLKRDDKLDVANDRQAAVTGVFPKIFMAPMLNRLVDYPNKFNKIYEFRHGFRKGFFTESPHSFSI